MKKRLPAVLLALCLTLTLLPGDAWAAETAPQWGTEVQWSYNEDTRTLTLTGSGPMPDGPPPCDRLHLVENLVIGEGITSVSAGAFQSRSYLERVSIPSSVTSIGDSAFYYCSGLTDVTFPQGLTSIGDSAFSGCYGLTGVTLPGDNLSIGSNVFSGCDNLARVTIFGAGVSIGESAFYSCDALTTVEMRKDVASIGNYAFSYCDALTAVKIQGNAGPIGKEAFYFCDALTTVEIGGDAASIGESAFSYCYALTAVKIQGNAGPIGEMAFYGCGALTAVEIGGDAASIGESAFRGLEALTEVRVAGSLGDVGGDAFAGCTGLTSFPSTGGMTGEIGGDAFYNCTGLHRVLLPEGLTAINSSAFGGCENLTAVWIPDSVKSLGSEPLDPHTVKDIYYGGTKAQWEAIKGHAYVQYDGLPVIHYDCPRQLPETAAADYNTLRRLIEDGAKAGLTEIELTDDIDLGGATLDIPLDCNVLLDLKGRELISWGNPAFITVLGSLTVMDSTETVAPAVTGHSVTYSCRGSISSDGRVIDVRFGGAFSLQSGTVRGGGPDAAAITVTGPRTYEENEDNIETTVTIEGGYVEAAGPAVLASGETRVTVDGGVLLSSGGEAVILGGAEETQRGPSICMYESGVLINHSSQFSCGVCLPREGSMSFWGGRILVENGVGILLRDGYLQVASGRAKEIAAGGSGTGTLGGSPVALPAGRKIVLDQKSGFCGQGEYDLWCTMNADLAKEYAPEGIPVDGYELKERGDRYFFGPRVFYQITFDPNGGTGTGTVVTMTTDSSGRITALPPEPTKPGYVFRGWSSNPNYVGYGLEVGAKLSGDTTLYALWTPVGTYIIEFWYYWAFERLVAYRLTDTNGALADWPDLKVSEGTLVGWFVDGEKCGEDHVFTEDTAVWGRFPPNTPPPYDITFDPNGGSGSTVTLKTDDQGKLSSWPADPTRDGYVFMGWGGLYSSSSVGQEHTFYQSETLYAIWMPEGGYVISFYRNEDGSGVVPGTRNTNLRGRLQQWPDTPQRPGTDYIFSGWYSGASGGSRLARDHQFYGNTQVYAHWLQRSSAAAAGAFVITFDPNGGAGGTVLVTEPGGRLAFLPYSDPVRTGYTFDGWFTQPSGGTAVTTATVFTENATVYAHWTQNGGATDPDDPGRFTVTFDPNGGALPAGQSAALTTGADGKLAALPANPVREGYAFDGWFTQPSGGTAVTTATVFTEDTTVYAHWTRNGGATDPDDPGRFTVTFDPNGGALPAGQSATLTTGADGKLAALPANPVREGYTFDGWFTLQSGGAAVTTATVFTENATVYAHWTQNGGTTDPDDPDRFTVTFDPNGGTGGGALTTGADGKLPALPANPVRTGYTFDGWFTLQTDGAAVTTATVFTENATVYAHWTQNGGTTDPDDPDRFTVTFDPNGGTGGGALTTGADGKLPALPANPVRTGYTFDGWFTLQSGGTAVTTATVFTEDTTVYARWSTQTAPTVRHRIYTPYRTPGGSLYVSHTYAAEGTRVTIEVDPRRGYELDWLSVTDLDTGRELRLNQHDSDEYSFIMPAGDVEVEITFAAR